LSVIAGLAVATAVARPSDDLVPDAVEEDWSLVIANPDPTGVGPQITTVMSPTSSSSDAFFAFDMNYREYPVFAAGGMQVQTWSGGKVIGTSTQGSDLFNTPNETLTWTQRLSVNDGQVVYDVNNGQSTTWGQFGQGATLQVSNNFSSDSLIGYDPAYSAAHSGASWQSNNVTSLTLVRVRYYANGKLLRTDTNPRVVVAPSDNGN
jgi:hypothetical protein